MPPGAPIDVGYLARLARIALTAPEAEKIAAELAQVLSYIEQLREVNVEGVEPTAHAVPLTNVTRTDEIRPSLSPAETFRNAPSALNDLFVVPKIVE